MDDVIESGLDAPVDTATAPEVLPVDTVDAGTAPDADDKEKQAAPEKTFSQAEMDAAIQKRLAKESRRIERSVQQRMQEQAEARAREVAPRREAFADDDDYLAAQVDHLAEQKAAAKLSQREAARTQETANEAFAERAEAVKAKHADFDAVVSNPTLSINDAMAEFIKDSDAGPDIAYFLGKNPTKAADIASLSPVKAARELARIEAELSTRPAVKTSSAPAPINPVGSRGSAAPTIANSDFSEYKKLRAAQGARWSR